MCDAGTLALVAAATSAAGSLTAGYGAYQSGQFNQKVAENNAVMSLRHAEDAKRRGNLAEAQLRKDADALKGTQKVATAANNVVVGSGSSLDILQATAEAAELDALTIRNNAERQAVGLQFDAQNSRAQGKLAAMEGKYGLASGVLQAGSTMIGGASKYKSMR